MSADLYEPERRGFDKYRSMDIMEEEIIIIRGKFHRNYILLKDKNLINENDLYQEEENWIEKNKE